MQLFGIRTELIKPGEGLVDVIITAALKHKLTIEDRDILVFASKAVATARGRIVQLSSIEPSKRAKKLAKEIGLEANHVELVLQEADEIYGGVTRTLLTLKSDVLIPNAGVDLKNAPPGYAVLWPKNPHKTAEKIRMKFLRRTRKHIGVLIIDSRITPLRMGTTSIAIGIAGFEPIRDCRVDRDLYGNPLFITRHALADDISCAAHLIMGEVNERVPAVLVKNAPVKFNEKIDPQSTLIPKNQCLFMNVFTRKLQP